jgi:nitrate reductase gamma subunit
MAQQPVRKRFWFASLVGAVGAVLFVLTLITPDWIEEVFHVDPDRGSGALEIAIAVGLLAVAGVSAVLARRKWTRPLPEGADGR